MLTYVNTTITMSIFGFNNCRVSKFLFTNWLC